MRKAIAIMSCAMFMMWVMGTLTSTSHAAGMMPKSTKCPTCNLKATKEPRPKGGVYTQMKHICPSCKQEHTRASTGDSIHVCPQCGAEINECPVCAEKS